MRGLVPSIKAADLRKTAGLALAGALVAGIFGIVHDQITFTISPEYFTRMKFYQFRGADFGFPQRVFVAEIGFLATWWVGLIAGWFLARLALPRSASPGKRVMMAMAVIVGVTVVGGAGGYFVGPAFFENRSEWGDALVSLGVTDATAFYRVAAIHFGSYAGAFFGWLAMMVVLGARVSRLAGERGGKE